VSNTLWEGAGGGIIAAIIGVSAAILKPWSDKAKQEKKDTEIMRLFVKGAPGTKGLIGEILPAPERVEALEQARDAQAIEIGAMQKLMYEHGDTIAATKRGVENLTREFNTYKSDNARNGGGGPGLGDSLWRGEMLLKALAKKAGIDIDAVVEQAQEDKTP
jgi:hypothetical protein